MAEFINDMRLIMIGIGQSGFMVAEEPDPPFEFKEMVYVKLLPLLGRIIPGMSIATLSLEYFDNVECADGSKIHEMQCWCGEDLYGMDKGDAAAVMAGAIEAGFLRVYGELRGRALSEAWWDAIATGFAQFFMVTILKARDAAKQN